MRHLIAYTITCIQLWNHIHTGSTERTEQVVLLINLGRCVCVCVLLTKENESMLSSKVGFMRFTRGKRKRSKWYNYIFIKNLKLTTKKKQIKATEKYEKKRRRGFLLKRTTHSVSVGKFIKEKPYAYQLAGLLIINVIWHESRWNNIFA